MIELDQLYYSQKNVHTLIRNRGYIGNLSIVPKSVLQEHLLNYGLEILDIHVVDKDRQLFVRYINESNVKAVLKIIKFIHEMYTIQATDDIILIYCQQDTGKSCFDIPIHSNKLLDLECTDHENIRILQLKQLQFDIVSNIMVPKHMIASDIEIQALKTQYYLRNLNQLPIILYSDPISRYYGYRSKMVIKIQRKTGIIYRLVKKVDTGLSGSHTVDISSDAMLENKEILGKKAVVKEAVVKEAVGKKASEEVVYEAESENTTHSKTCSVYIGKKRERGVKGSKNPVITGYINIDATSGSGKKIKGHSAKEAFSPMYLGPVVSPEIEAKLFENYWQYSKVFKELGHVDESNNITDHWHKFREKGFAKETGDRHPEGTKSKEVIDTDIKGRNRYRYYTPEYAVYNGEKMYYVTSRKKIYAPVYAELVKKQPAFIELKKLVDKGGKYQILDLDGPTDQPSHLITVDLLKHKINDVSAPFGHGYVLAGLLCGIEPEQYCI